MLHSLSRLSPGALPLLLALGCTDYVLSPAEKDPEPEPDCRLDDAVPADVEIDGSCLFEAEEGYFKPVVEWQWSKAVGSAGHDDVMMTPVVGDVDRDGMPEIVFTSYTGTGYTVSGALTILSGDGAGEEGSWTSVGGYSPCGSGGVALGDLEGDGLPEIVFVTSDTRVVAMHADGSLLWASESRPLDFTVMSYPVLADLDADGQVEIIAGRAIFTSDGLLAGVGAWGQGGSYAIPVVADLDMDGIQEVVVGNAAYHKDGSALWTNEQPDGWTAVGDFDMDGMGEVVSVKDGSAWLFDQDGTLLWGPVVVPGGGGGPPTVADFDGDGAPEVGVAGYEGYVVYDTDGTELWMQVTTDYSSARTGSSVFDFEGDGAWEVVYGDELILWVFDGATGAPLLADDRHSSWTLFEYPVIVDVDADGEAEIVLANNDSINPGWQGISVFGDATGSWAPTTPVWNQHAYHITNVEDDLSIPTHPVMNWNSGHNSFRAGGLRDRPGLVAPDLEVDVISVCWTCVPAWVELAAQVTNRGTNEVTQDISVSLYARAEDGSHTWLATEWLDGPLDAGRASESLIFSAGLPEISALKGVLLRVDDGGEDEKEPGESGAIEECDERNNEAWERLDGC